VGDEANWQIDIIDEAISVFKANILFKTFEFEGGADRLLAYIILYITQCLGLMANKPKDAATKALFTLARDNFALPGEGKFPLGGHVSAPGRGEAETLKNYLQELRHETGVRLIEHVYARDQAQPDKWWVCFSKRKFMDLAL